MTRRRGRWVGPEGAGTLLRLGILLLVAAGVSAVLLAGAAHAEPSPVPGPTPGDSPNPTPAPEADEEDSPGKVELSPTPTPPAKDADKSRDDIIDERAEAEAEREKDKAAQEARQEAAWDKLVDDFKEKSAKNGGVLGAFSVTDEHGYPADAYEVSVDSGGITAVTAKIQAFLIEGAFAVTKWTIALGCWLIVWALSWSLASILLKPAMAVSDALYNQAIVQLGLPTLLLTFSGVVACWHLFFGRRSRGWGELAASTVISALAITTFAAPPQMLLSADDGAVGEVRKLGLTVAALVLGEQEDVTEEDPAKFVEEQQDGVTADTDPGVETLTRPISDALVDAFIVKPSMLLTYGQVFSGDCAQQYADSRIEQALFNSEIDKAKKDVLKKVDENTITGGLGLDNFVFNKAFDFVKEQVVDTEPSEAFEEECVEGNAEQHKKASWDKVIGAGFVLLAALLVFVLFLVLGCSYLAVQALLALEAMLFRVALAIGILPGPGRAWLWERCVSILRLLGALIAIAIGLAVFILVIATVLGAEPDEIPGGITIRFVVVDLLCVAAFFCRKRIAQRGRTIAADLRTRMGHTPLGGSAPVQLNTDGGGRRSVASRVASAGLMLGAMATGGTSAAAMGMARGGRGALGARLAARTARGGGRAAARTATGAAKAAGAAGKFGLKYTVGAPVYGPRAARAATAAARAMPGTMRERATSLQQRLHTATGPNSRIRNFGAEYWNNVGGRRVYNRYRLHRGLSPIPPPAPRTEHRSGGTPSTRRGRATSLRYTPAAPARPAPWRATPPQRTPGQAPPGNARHASLQRRLHRARTGGPAPPASPSSPAPGAGPLPPPPRRPGRGGSTGRRRRL